MMIAYLPADDPEIAIGIRVEYGGYGARTGDLVVDIANAYFAMKDGSLTQQAEAEKEAEQAQQEDQAQTTDPAQAAAGQTAGNAAAQPAQMTPAADTAAPGNGSRRGSPACRAGRAAARRAAMPLRRRTEKRETKPTRERALRAILNGNIPEKKTKLNILYKNQL